MPGVDGVLVDPAGEAVTVSSVSLDDHLIREAISEAGYTVAGAR